MNKVILKNFAVNKNMTIEIWNPKEMPFGSLSNGATYIMKIENETYTTVTNYIYSNLLNNKEYFGILKHLNTKDVYEYLNRYDKDYINSTILKSLKEATVQKFKNKELEEILLTTENYPIVFISDDNLMGSGREGFGKNFVGKILMDIRNSIMTKKGEKEKKLYEAYTALEVLEKTMLEEGNDLSNFSGLNQKEIIEKHIYMKGIERAKIQKIDLSKSSYQEIINKYRYILREPSKNIINTLSQGGEENLKLLQILEASIKRPHILFLYVKKKYISGLRFTQLKKIKDTIFDIYVHNVLETRYPELPKNKYNEAMDKEFNINAIEYDVLKDQIYELYKKKVLNEHVMEKIKMSVNFKVIPENTVSSIEGIDIDELVKMSKPEDNKLVISFRSYSNFEETPYYILSPFIYTDMLEINGLKYPSVMHYVMATLFSTLPDVKTIQNAHKMILLNPEGSQDDNLNYDNYEQLFYKYDNEKYYQFNKLKKRLASIGLNKKFEDIGLQELLLATGNNQLIWNDPYDEILGVGFSKGGENFVGKYLMELRDKIKKNEESLENIKQGDISRIMENDIFMRSWSEMRLNDICKVVKQVKKYIIKKYKVEEEKVNIDYTFILNVLNKVYYQCNDLVPDFDKNKTTPPQYFRSLVKTCFGFNNTTEDIITLLWDRIVIMIYFISKHIPKLKNIKNVLAKIEIIVSSKNKCINIINNNQDNCIISAIVNIIKKLSEFNSLYGYPTNTNKDDVETAINIILNRGVKLDTKSPEFNTFTRPDEYNDINVLNVGSFDIPDVDPNMTDFNDEENYFDDAEKRIEQYEDNDEEEDDEEDIYDTMYDLEKEEADADAENNEDYGSYDGSKYKRPTPNPDRWINIQRQMEEKIENMERMRFEKYKNVNKIALFLDENGIISSNNTILAEYIIDAVIIIKKFQMPNKVKTNRINFFATTV